MIGKLVGIIAGHYGNVVLLDVCCNNCAIGYEVIMKQNDIEVLANGELATIFIKEIIKEDEDSLYGFLSFEDRCWFEEFTKMSGLGPKTALAILSTYTCEAITEAIMMNNCDFFSAVSGIGGKLANRIPVEMKKQVEKINEKVLNFGIFDRNSTEKNIINNKNNEEKQKNMLFTGEKSNNGTDAMRQKHKTAKEKDNTNDKKKKNSSINDAIDALSVLGFSRQQVYEDVFKIIKNNNDLTTEEIVKEFLKGKGNK